MIKNLELKLEKLLKQKKINKQNIVIGENDK